MANHAILLESVVKGLVGGVLTKVNPMNWTASLHRMQGTFHPHSYLERQEREASPSIVDLEARMAFDLDDFALYDTEGNPPSPDVGDFGDS